MESYEFVVEDTLYKVPNHYFDLEAGVISKAFASCPKGQPIRLLIKRIDFEILLSMMYPTKSDSVGNCDRDKWESLIKLSAAWGLSIIRALAISALESIGIGSVVKAGLGQTCRIPAWVTSGYTELVVRLKPLSEEECEMLGAIATGRICRIREEYIRLNIATAVPKVKTKKNAKWAKRIGEAFVGELEEAASTKHAKSAMLIELMNKHGEANCLPPTPSTIFYMESVVFRVQSTLFKVPRLPFELVEPFATMFSLPQTSDNESVLEGSNDQTPLLLDGIASSDFQAFLKALYPPGITLASLTTLTDDGWESVLKLSTMWDFPEIRGHAIHHLRKQVDCIKAVQLATRYAVSEWLPIALHELLIRQRTIDRTESLQLGIYANGILRIREKLLIARLSETRAPVIHVPGAGTQELKDNPFENALFDHVKAIREEFEDELKDCGAWTFLAAPNRSRGFEHITIHRISGHNVVKTCPTRRQDWKRPIMTTVDSTTKDLDYYMESYEFIAEETLFKVPRQQFEGSLVNKAFASCIITGQPIRLRVKKMELEALLSVMYPRSRAPVALSQSDWESVLNMSTAWGLHTVHAVARDTLLKKDLGSLAKALLGQSCKISAWIKDGYRELVERSDSITEEEGVTLGGAALSRVCQMRERRIRGTSTQFQSLTSRPAGAGARYDSARDIEQLFAVELEQAAATQPSVMHKMTVMMIELENKHSVSSHVQPVLSQSYYMDDITFKIEDVLFKVPQASFEKAEPFYTMFGLPQNPQLAVASEGLSDDTPLRIEGVTADDFRAFMKALYPAAINLESLKSLSSGDWESVLKLSTMWDFPDIRGHAITHLKKQVDCINGIRLSAQYKIPAWLPVALEQAVTRQVTINKAESRLLGLYASGILRIREMMLMAHLDDIRACNASTYYELDSDLELQNPSLTRTTHLKLSKVIREDTLARKNTRVKGKGRSFCAKAIREEFKEELKDCGA
ncbi:hypothetical protein HWV62_6839 [Athelia sp. TMB]|nr:hypothetical protein HWV62_6839 [Athelia sp. TMB]